MNIEKYINVYKNENFSYKYLGEYEEGRTNVLVVDVKIKNELVRDRLYYDEDNFLSEFKDFSYMYSVLSSLNLNDIDDIVIKLIYYLNNTYSHPINLTNLSYNRISDTLYFECEEGKFQLNIPEKFTYEYIKKEYLNHIHVNLANCRDFKKYHKFYDK